MELIAGLRQKKPPFNGYFHSKNHLARSASWQTSQSTIHNWKTGQSELEQIIELRISLSFSDIGEVNVYLNTKVSLMGWQTKSSIPTLWHFTLIVFLSRCGCYSTTVLIVFWSSKETKDTLMVSRSKIKIEPTLTHSV